MLGALGLMWLARGQNGGDQTPRSLASLLNADMSSSGVSSFGGNVKNLEAPSITPIATGEILSGNIAFTAMAVDAVSGVPLVADKLTPEKTEITGTLNALFEAQGVTVSEISGNAVRQVGVLSPLESILNTANIPSVAFVDITTEGGGAPVLLEEDTPIEVLPPAQGAPRVLTIFGNDETTVVTTGSRNFESYFTTPGTLIEAVNQGYFDAAPAYEPISWQQIELESGLTGRQEAAAEAAAVRIADAYAFVAEKEAAEADALTLAGGMNWWYEG